ncbi:MAG: alpha/beta hydrolase [Chloroflexota bacterium]
MTDPLPEAPSQFIRSPDGTRIAVFSGGAGDGPPLVLVHGTTGDHRTWRVVWPRLAERHRLHAIDRRGRGDSGDGAAYSIERELDDVAAVAEALAAESGGPVDVLGHSLGGRIALGASLRTAAIRRVVACEGAPTPRSGRHTGALLAALRADLAAGDLETLLARFMTAVTGMTEADLARFRADPVWPLRVAAAPTIVRELEAADEAPAVSPDALARAAVPVLQVVGTASPPAFRDGAVALDARLAAGRLVVIEGAGHAAHHSHPDALIAAVEAFLAS